MFVRPTLLLPLIIKSVGPLGLREHCLTNYVLTMLARLVASRSCSPPLFLGNSSERDSAYTNGLFGRIQMLN